MDNFLDICREFGTAFIDGSASKYFSNDRLYYLVIAYLITLPMLTFLAKKYQPYLKYKALCDKFVLIYNGIMAIYSFLSFACIAIAMLRSGVFVDDPFSDPLYSEACRIFYLSKYVEFLDTWFLVLKNRPLAWLQIIHHAGAPIDMGLWVSNRIPGTGLFVLLNGLVHTFMYSYYALALLKISVPWKQSLTTMQILQFLTGFSIIYQYKYIPSFWNLHLHRFAW